MTAPEPSLPAEELAAAAAVRRLADALLGHDIDHALSAEVADVIGGLAERVEQSPSRTKAQAFRRYSGHQRIEHFVETGQWPAPPPDGDPLLFDALSFVGGALSPAGGGVTFRRVGERAVATAVFGPTYEGPPTRVHGGMLAATFDEVMGAVFRAAGLPSAFTATLSVRFEGPAPLGVELTFEAWLDNVDGRKYRVKGEATGPDGRFASAEGLFIAMAPEHLAEAIAD